MRTLDDKKRSEHASSEQPQSQKKPSLPSYVTHVPSQDFAAVSFPHSYIVFVTGLIASGKSFAAQYLEKCGCIRFDLDELSKQVLAPQSLCLAAIAREFGQDLLDDTGALNRGLLAKRAFESDAARERLEALELPWIFSLLKDKLSACDAQHATYVGSAINAIAAKKNTAKVCTDLINAGNIDPNGARAHNTQWSQALAPRQICIVELTLLDRAAPILPWADEVIYVRAACETRKARAHSRGMCAEDFERRARFQPSDRYLLQHADTVIDNEDDVEALQAALDAWLARLMCL